VGLWQNLAVSYDNNADALMSRYPLSTTTISNNQDSIAVIVIDDKGNFIKAEKIEKTKKDKEGNYVVASEQICIPVTEESMGRSSNVSPHPVFDQYDYLKGDGKKYDEYIRTLKDFAESSFATEQVKAIYQYAKKQTIASDLSGMKLKGKQNVVFKVVISGNPQKTVWENQTFFNAWHQYYLSKKAEQSLDYITGTIQQTATSHPKKISNAAANAKLISDNDTKNYTFRGKFNNSLEALSIGYETSQKAHQFLRYLINEQGYYCGEQVILSFTISSMKKTLPSPLDDTKSIYQHQRLKESSTKTERDRSISLLAETGFDYTDALNKTLASLGYGNALEQHAKTAVVALDAATTGRLSITFYRELNQKDYLEKIADWHSGCRWGQRFWDKENKKYVPYIGAPSVDKIIEAVYGKPRGGQDESYTKIKKAARERLLRCIFDGAFLPKDYVVAAVRRASNPLAITTKNGKFDSNGFEQIVSTACALVRKDYQQRQKEDYKLSIEHNRDDRDYLYGRLLGAADKLEEYVLRKEGKDRITTAAIRHMQAFSQHPFRTWETIHNCLIPYIQKVKGNFAYKEIEEIKKLFVSGDFEKDMPLNGSYLLGYYHERAYINDSVKAFNSKKQSTNFNKEEDNYDRQ